MKKYLTNTLYTSIVIIARGKMLVKIEFRQGSFQLLDTGDMFESVKTCREAFLELLNGKDIFFSYNDFRGNQLLINRDNITRVVFDYQRDANPEKKTRYRRVKVKR